MKITLLKLSRPTPPQPSLLKRIAARVASILPWRKKQVEANPFWREGDAQGPLTFKDLIESINRDSKEYDGVPVFKDAELPGCTGVMNIGGVHVTAEGTPKRKPVPAEWDCVQCDDDVEVWAVKYPDDGRKLKTLYDIAKRRWPWATVRAVRSNSEWCQVVVVTGWKESD